jgi:unsaturated chondroitin disaccharide hydrolase
MPVGPTVSLLACAADHTGDERLRDVAGRLAVWTLSTLMRRDGSMAQAATYDPTTGDALSVYTAEQGLSRDSTWARSQAWGLLAAGTAALRCPPVADTARAHGRLIADWWISHCGDGGGWLPRWDFDAPAGDPLDTSAAAIATAGLLRLAVAEDGAHSRIGGRYARAADRTIGRLLTKVTPIYDGDPRPAGMLSEGCYHRPHGLAVNAELVWGDYYLLESLMISLGELDIHRL